MTYLKTNAQQSFPCGQTIAVARLHKDIVTFIDIVNGIMNVSL